MMKENRKSLRIYFIVWGALATIVGLRVINYVTVTERIAYGLLLIIGIGYLYYGIKLYDFLLKSPKTLMNFVVITTIIRLIISPLFNQKIFTVIIFLLVSTYLFFSIKKLSSIPPSDS